MFGWSEPGPRTNPNPSSSSTSLAFIIRVKFLPLQQFASSESGSKRIFASCSRLGFVGLYTRCLSIFFLVFLSSLFSPSLFLVLRDFFVQRSARHRCQDKGVSGTSAGNFSDSSTLHIQTRIKSEREIFPCLFQNFKMQF